MKECKKCGMKHIDDLLYCKKCHSILYPIKRPNVFLKEEYNSIALEDEIFVCGTYQPYRRGYNPYFDQYSQRILNIKNIRSREGIGRNLDVVSYFQNLLFQIIKKSEEYVICVVPPHDAKGDFFGILVLASLLTGKCIDQNGVSYTSKAIDGTELIKRSQSIPKKSDTRIRDEEIERGSITITNKNKIKNQHVLLLDDVTTQGFSLSLYKKILLENGAKTVVPLALGETWKYHMFGYRVWNP